MARYRAVITQKKRDMNCVPRVQLRYIVNLDTGEYFRSHTWVRISHLVAKVVPSGHPRQATPKVLEFDAEEKEYPYKDENGLIKHELYKIQDINVVRVIGNKKVHEYKPDGTDRYGNK